MIEHLVDCAETGPRGLSSSSTFGQIDRLRSRLNCTEAPQTPDGRQHQRTSSSRLRDIFISADDTDDDDDDDGSHKRTERKQHKSGSGSENENESESESSRVYAILSSAKRDRDTDKVIEALHETARQAIQSPIRRNRLASSVSGMNRSRPSTPGSCRATPYTMSRTGAAAGAGAGTGIRPRKLTFSSNTTTTTEMPTTMMAPSDESRVSKRIVSPWRDGVGYALKKREEKEGPLKHGPRPSMAGSADWTRRSSKGTCTEGSVVNDDESQPPVPQVPQLPQLPECRDRASLELSSSTSTSIGVSPKPQSKFKINHPDTVPSVRSERSSLSVSTSQLHPSNSTSTSSVISSLPRPMRKVSPGIMSRASALLDRTAAESSSSGQSTISTRRASPAELTTAPTSLEPSDDDEGGPSSPCPSPSPRPVPGQSSEKLTTMPESVPKIATATANATATTDEDQLAKERELANLRCELERNAIILRALVDKLRD